MNSKKTQRAEWYKVIKIEFSQEIEMLGAGEMVQQWRAVLLLQGA